LSNQQKGNRMTDKEALTKALILAVEVDSPTQSQYALSLAIDISKGMSREDVESCKSAAHEYLKPKFIN